MAQKRTPPRKKASKKQPAHRRRAKNSRKSKRETRNAKSGSRKLETQNTFEWWHLALIAAVTFIVYIPSLSNGFVNWDDPKYIINNEVIHSFSGENLATSFSPTIEVSDNYHPLTDLSQTIDWVLGGGSPTLFHITSLILHILNALLVFFFVRMFTGKNWVGLGVALIFSLHPMHVESVAWATERKDVLYGLFFLLSLISYLKYLRLESRNHYIYALIFALLSLFSKPAAIPLPMVLLLMDYFEGRKLNEAKVWLEKLPFFALAIIFGLITLSIQSDDAVRTLGELSLGDRILFAAYAYAMYIIKFFIPYPLYAFYSYPDLSSIPGTYYGIAMIGLVITGAVLWLGRNNKYLWFGLFFFLLVVSISLQLVAVGGAIMADRYTYIPYVGLGIALLMGMDALITERPNLLAPLRIAGIAALAVMAALTWKQTETWKDGEALWTNLIDHSPRPVRIAYTNRGEFYKDNKQYEKALVDLNKALEISPGEPGTLSIRAKTLFDMQRYQESLVDYKNLSITKPDDVETWSNIAIIQVLTKQYEDALKSLERTLQIDPNYASSYKTQGYLYNDLGRHQASINAYQKFLQLNGDDATVYHSIALSYAQLGDRQKALDAINQAIRLRPDAQEYQRVKQQLTGS